MYISHGTARQSRYMMLAQLACPIKENWSPKMLHAIDDRFLVSDGGGGEEEVAPMFNWLFFLFHDILCSMLYEVNPSPHHRKMYTELMALDIAVIRRIGWNYNSIKIFNLICGMNVYLISFNRKMQQKAITIYRGIWTISPWVPKFKFFKDYLALSMKVNVPRNSVVEFFHIFQIFSMILKSALKILKTLVSPNLKA